MKRAILTLLISSSLVAITFAQTPGYYLIYGNRDGSDLSVLLDVDIEIEVWAATPSNSDLDGDGVVDSIYFMHNPLASNDTVIASRDSGLIVYPLCGFFLPPNPDIDSGYTNQSMAGGCPFGPLFNTGGDTVHIATFLMRAADNPDYVNQTLCPFIEGYDPANGGILWGIQGGVTPIYPAQTFSCLHFVDYFAGDANGSGEVNGLDVVYLVNYLKGIGPAPDPILSGDANGDCLANGLDVIYLVNYLKGFGPPPVLGSCP